MGTKRPGKMLLKAIAEGIVHEQLRQLLDGAIGGDGANYVAALRQRLGFTEEEMGLIARRIEKLMPVQPLIPVRELIARLE